MMFLYALSVIAPGSLGIKFQEFLDLQSPLVFFERCTKEFLVGAMCALGWRLASI